MIVLTPLTIYNYINNVWGCNTHLINTFANQSSLLHYPYFNSIHHIDKKYL